MQTAPSMASGAFASKRTSIDVVTNRHAVARQMHEAMCALRYHLRFPRKSA
jgi:hypothetical protein